MKSRLYFLYFLAFLLVIASVYVVLDSKQEENVEEILKIDKTSFSSGQTISLLDVQNGQIKQVDLDYYLYCVTASEMPFEYNIEAIKAQVIVARTYLFNKILSGGEEGADACTDFNHCQAYTEIEKLEEAWKKKGFLDAEIANGESKIKQAVEQTRGKVITYDGKIINALFHASSPERTENARAIWTGEDVPYLQSVENMEDEDYERRNTVVTKDYDSFKNTLIDKGYISNLSKEEFLNVRIGEYTESGRVKNIIVGETKIKAEDLRKIFGLYSTNFSISVNDEQISFNVLGFGHGVGMSQVGANYYAKQGYTYEEIIHHYYKDVDIVDKEREEL